MSHGKNLASCRRIFDSFEFTLFHRMFLQTLRIVGATSLLVAIAAGGSASAQTKASTVTSLTVSPSGSVAVGTVVTLTAHVTAGSANVSPGQVNFCDAAAAYCLDIDILATAQLTSSGTATYKFRPGIGSHSYKAVFLGTNSYAGSNSSASPLTVTGTVGPFATATSIAETGAWGNYTLTGTVTEAGGTVAPTGTVSFIDTSNGNSVLASGSLGAAIAGIGWPNPGSLTNTLDTYFVLVADFNGDGIPDLMLDSNPEAIYLGNANGTYTEAASPPSMSYPIVTADFNGDGIPDLAGLYDTSEIAILLGNGDGTFAELTASVPGSDVYITQILVADFNGDGIPDLAVIDGNNSVIDILLGNGNGTFTAETTNPPISGSPVNFATGDFNGDGKADLAVTENNGTIAILLGNGDGTFTASGSVNSASSGAPSPIAVADFNNDGKLDIAVPAGGVGTSESVSVLTGNGDGTFNSPFPSPGSTSTSVTWIQVADFNQDGAADVVIADSSGDATVFLNNGAGSLNENFPVVSGLNVPGYLEVGVGDLNGDGYPDIVAGGYYDNTLGLYFTEPTETANASASVQVNGVGQHLVEASFPAEGSYESSISSSIPLWGVLPTTSTSLSVTVGGSTVTSVTPGTAVLLTANVTAGTAPVTAGQVNFCNASAPYCTDIQILGSSALSSSGIATFIFVPGPGAHSYQAQFVEDGFGLASASTVASLNVGPVPNPVYSDTAAITSNGSPGDYSLTATVTGYGGPASPTGIVSFIDTSFGNNVLATASVGTGVTGIGFLESSSPSFGSYPAGEVTADFNGDGIPDLAVISNTTAYGGPVLVTILFGKGDGTFTAGPAVQPAGIQSFPTMIGGDFNGDGKADLAVLSYNDISTSYITVLLGNGDGTFGTPQTTPVYNQPVTGGDLVPGTLVTADFNGDGKLDVAVVGDYISSGGVTILLGNGDGTFTAVGPNLDLSADFGLIATGDFNGDGIPDLVVTSYFEDGTPPTIFLGKGDGAFTAANPSSFTLAYSPTSIVVGDFNGDGVLDVAFSDLNGVEIALGNGDGTFNETSASPIQVPSELYSLQAGDFNHDGKLDLAGLDTYFDQIDILLGAGDGTFAVTTTTPGVNASIDSPHQIAAADFNGDGVPDLAMLTRNVNAASILLTEPTETATATVNGIAPIGAGTHYVDAGYAGDSHYSAVTSSTIGLTPVLDSPVVSPAAGTYTSAQTLTISEAIPGSTIYYQLTGPVSTNGYVQYTAPVSLPDSGVEVLAAYATETGYNQSSYLSAEYTINIPGFGPGAGGTTSLTVMPGTTTGNTGTISVAGTNGFSGIVNLTCSVTTTITGVSDKPTCSLKPASVTISGAAAQTSTLTVNTTAASSAANQRRSIFWSSASMGIFAFVLLLVKSRKGRSGGMLIGLLLLSFSAGLIACGGSNGSGGGGGGTGGSAGTTPGAYTITVIGASGSVSATVGTVALTVQ